MAGGHAGGGDSGDYETSSVGLVGPHKPPFQRAGSLDRLPTRPTAHKTSFSIFPYFFVLSVSEAVCFVVCRSRRPSSVSVSRAVGLLGDSGGG